MGKFWFFLWAFSWPWLVQGGVLQLDPYATPLTPLGEIELLRDASGAMTLEQARQATDWKPNQQKVPNFSFDKAAFWLRIQLHHPSDGFRHWVLEVGSSLIDYLDVYVINEQGAVTSFHTGDRRPFSTRPLEYVNFSFPLDLAPDEMQTVYLRIANYDGIHEAAPLYLWTDTAFALSQHQTSLLYGLYFGAILVIVAYNLFIFFGVRDISYFYYVLYAATFLLFVVVFRGFAAQYFLPNHPIALNQGMVMLATLWAMLLALFFIHFLKLNYYTPRLERFVRWVVGYMALLLVPLGLGVYTLVLPFFDIGCLALVVCMFLGAGITAKKGSRPAWFFLLAWSWFLLGGLLYLLKVLDLVESNLITENGLQLGSVIEMLLLSLGLADRINQLKQERQNALHETAEAQRKLLEMVNAQAYELERKVEERTQALLAAQAQTKTSIEYAKRIQQSLLPRRLDSLPGSSFALWFPRDIIGGDFYHLAPVQGGHILAIFDCTGHGVPGAFMTMVASAVLRQLLWEVHEPNPALILQRLTQRIQAVLYQRDPDNPTATDGPSCELPQLEQNDGMDGAICFLPHQGGELVFAGARCSIYLSSQGNIREIKGNRESIGYRDSAPDYAFANHPVELHGIDAFYLCTDGIIDQKGGNKSFPLGNRRWQVILSQVAKQPWEGQKAEFTRLFDLYKGTQPQVDDITLLGVKPLPQC